MPVKSTYLDYALLDLILGAVNPTGMTFTASANTAAGNIPPATIYLALFTVAPTAAGGGTEVPTAGGTNYSRLAVPNNTGNWPLCSANGGTKQNGLTLNWPQALNAGGWGAIVAVGMYDQATGGNLLYFGTVATKTIGQGDIPQFPPGSIQITEN